MIKRFSDEDSDIWDRLVGEKSVNGCFQQTRRFLNYHKNRFLDHSLMFYKENELIAVMPACEEGDALISHKGATFGGIIISGDFCSINNYKRIIDELLEYLVQHKIRRLSISMPSWLYVCKDEHIDIFEYLLRNNGFHEYEEVGFFVDIDRLPDDFERDFATLKRRKLKKSIKAGLKFRQITTEDQIKQFHYVLTDNYKKFDSDPVHSFDEMIALWRTHIPEEIGFYGVYHEDRLIAGSMTFDFNKKHTFHTQYLASLSECLELCPNEYLYTELIRTAKDRGYRYLSFGNATLEHGKILNESLALYKEGFNTQTYLNRTYYIEL